MVQNTVKASKPGKLICSRGLLNGIVEHVRVSLCLCDHVQTFESWGHIKLTLDDVYNDILLNQDRKQTKAEEALGRLPYALFHSNFRNISVGWGRGNLLKMLQMSLMKTGNCPHSGELFILNTIIYCRHIWQNKIVIFSWGNQELPLQEYDKPSSWKPAPWDLVQWNQMRNKAITPCQTVFNKKKGNPWLLQATKTG